MSQDNQAFLNAELKVAVESGDEGAEKLVYLHYQQAVLLTLADLMPCERDASTDLTLLKKRVAKLSVTTERLIATVVVVPRKQVENLFTASRTLLGGVSHLCPDCRQQVKHTILSTFRTIRDDNSVREGGGRSGAEAAAGGGVLLPWHPIRPKKEQ